jgi:hypothetical protein
VAADLYLLVSRSPPGATEGPYTPCRIKATKNPATDPLVGFVSVALAKEFMSRRRISDVVCQIVPFSALDPAVAACARKQQVLFFDRGELLASYLEEGPAFSSAPHALSFEDAYARAQRAL